MAAGTAGVAPTAGTAMVEAKLMPNGNWFEVTVQGVRHRVFYLIRSRNELGFIGIFDGFHLTTTVKPGIVLKQML